MATDYFAVLGLPRGASDSDIKRAYRKLARDLHPDVNPDPGAKERFQEVTRAYEALTDPEKRRIVDLGGDPFETGGGAGGNGFGGAGFGGLGIVGPTRMDYPGNMAAVRAVARYVGHLLAES